MYEVENARLFHANATSELRLTEPYRFHAFKDSRPHYHDAQFYSFVYCVR